MLYLIYSSHALVHRVQQKSSESNSSSANVMVQHWSLLLLISEALNSNERLSCGKDSESF